MNFFKLGIILLLLTFYLFIPSKKDIVFKVKAKSKISLTLADIQVDEFQKRRVKTFNNGLLCSIICSVFLENWILVLIIATIISFSLLIPSLKIRSLLLNRRRNIQYQFPIWLRQVQVLLNGNTIPNAMKQSVQYAPKVLRKDLNELVELIQHDSTRYEYYAHFLSRLNMIEVTRAMKLLYRYQLIGSIESQFQFNQMIMITSKWLRKQRNDSQESTIAYYQWLGIIPLIIVTLLFMVFMFMVIMQLLERR